MSNTDFPALVTARRSDFQPQALRLLAMGMQRVQAILPDLDPAFWNDSGVCAQLQAFALGHPQARCQLCVHDSANVRRDNPRLMHLLERLPSRMEIRLTDAQHQGMGESLILVDQRYFLRRSSPQADQWQSYGHLPNEAPRLAALFEEVWGKAASHPDLRSLRL